MRILILDNYDSFTYNLFHLLEAVAPSETIIRVFRNDAISIEDASTFDKIVLSPGPGLPDDAGITKNLVQSLAGKKSILGVCLGHQAIGEVFGARLKNLSRVLHGVSLETRVLKKDYLFNDCPMRFETGRYHSWVIDPDGLPGCLEITARDTQDNIMAVRHHIHDIRGIQFHPESIMTNHGRIILSNWVNKA